MTHLWVPQAVSVQFRQKPRNKSNIRTNFIRPYWFLIRIGRSDPVPHASLSSACCLCAVSSKKHGTSRRYGLTLFVPIGFRAGLAVPIPFRLLTRTIPAGYCGWLTCHWSWLRERDNLNGFPRHVVNLKTFYGVHGRSIDTIYCLWANKANRFWQFSITRTSSDRF